LLFFVWKNTIWQLRFEMGCFLPFRGNQLVHLIFFPEMTADIKKTLRPRNDGGKMVKVARWLWHVVFGPTLILSDFILENFILSEKQAVCIVWGLYYEFKMFSPKKLTNKWRKIRQH
jgi:hypothetical protein